MKAVIEKFTVGLNQSESVVRQVPEEAQVRRRAYFRQLDLSNDLPRQQHTDRTA